MDFVQSTTPLLQYVISRVAQSLTDVSTTVCIPRMYRFVLEHQQVLLLVMGVKERRWGPELLSTVPTVEDHEPPMWKSPSRSRSCRSVCALMGNLVSFDKALMIEGSVMHAGEMLGI